MGESNGRYSLNGLAARRAVAKAVVEPLLAGKKDRTIKSIYERSAPGSDGKVRTILAPRTASGRLASGESVVDESSTNLQNLPKRVARMDPLYRVREVFVPEEGMVFAAVDYRNAEGILCAAYSTDWAFYDQMMAGEDVHTMHAKAYFGTGITKLHRDIAKTIHYASLYMASPETITRSLNREAEYFGRTFTVNEVAGIRAKFLQLHPLEQWWQNVRAELDRNGGWLRNAFGFRRVFHDPDLHNRLKDGLSFFPQSTVSCLMNDSLPAVYALDTPGTLELLHQIHDELLFQVHPDAVDQLRATVTPLLERRFTIGDRDDVYVPVEWSVGETWGTMHQV